jgi:Tol biopolymer transport system component
LAYIPGSVSASATSRSLAIADREGRHELLKLPPGLLGVIRVSHDGKRAAVESDDGKDTFVSIYELDGSQAPRRLTFGGKNRSPVWSPKSDWIAFQSDRDGDAGIYQQRADGNGPAQQLTKPEPGASHTPNSWSPDGEIFTVRKQKGWNLFVDGAKPA